jgi:hypothetical protein
MRLKHTVRVQAALDTAMKRSLFNDDVTLSQVQTDGFASQANSILSIAAEGSESLSFGDVTLVKGLYLEVDQEALVHLNGSADAIQLRKATGATKAKLFVEADITEVEIENPSTTAVLTGVYVAWGDPIA